MKKGALLAGLICGVICVLCIVMYASALQEDANKARAEAMERYGGEQVDVLVATSDIYPGESLNASNTTMRTWLSDLLPEDCITKLEDVQNKQTTSLILAGEAISTRRFDGGSTQLDVPEGHVAISVPAEEVQAVGGTLSAGSRVDVYATGTKTTRLGSNMLVLATNADTDESSKTKVSWVTLAVPIEQSQEFVTASQSMDIYFALPALPEAASSPINNDSGRTDDGQANDSQAGNDQADGSRANSDQKSSAKLNDKASKTTGNQGSVSDVGALIGKESQYKEESDE